MTATRGLGERHRAPVLPAGWDIAEESRDWVQVPAPWHLCVRAPLCEATPGAALREGAGPGGEGGCQGDVLKGSGEK